MPFRSVAAAAPFHQAAATAAAATSAAARCSSREDFTRRRTCCSRGGIIFSRSIDNLGCSRSIHNLDATGCSRERDGSRRASSLAAETADGCSIGDSRKPRAAHESVRTTGRGCSIAAYRKPCAGHVAVGNGTNSGCSAAATAAGAGSLGVLIAIACGAAVAGVAMPVHAATAVAAATGAATTAAATAAAATGAATATAVAAAGDGLSDGAVWAVLCACAAGAQLLEQRTSWGQQVSSVLLAMLAAAVLASLSVLPTASPVYDFVWTRVMPMAVALVLLETDVTSAFTQSGPGLLAFLLGAAGTIAGTLVGFSLAGPSLGVEGWKVAACFCATYIGGSVNYAATAKALGMDITAGAAAASTGASLLTAGMAVDNLLMAAYFSVLAALPDSWPKPWGGERWGGVKIGGNSDESEKRLDTGLSAPLLHSSPSPSSPSPSASSSSSSSLHTPAPLPSPSPPSSSSSHLTHSPPPAPSVESLTLSIAAAASACALADKIAVHLPPVMASAQLALAALLASLLSTVAARLTGRGEKRKEGEEGEEGGSLFTGAETLGNSLMLVFFANIGASASVSEAMSAGGGLLAFVATVLMVHIVVVLLGGRLLNIPLDILMVASNANVGGPATAAAMASARNWPQLVRPAVLLGTFGYTIGTAIAFLLGINVLQPMAAAAFAKVL